MTVEPARACSCIPPDPWTFLKQADGAFVGRLVSRREADQGQAVLLFSVDRAVKGRIGTTVEVTTANNGSACGIETSVGQRIGLFLDRNGNRWVGHLCWQVSPEDLLAAARPLPPPNGREPVALVVSGRFGEARLLALDGRGRTVAYGIGGGRAELVSICPGRQRLAELASTGSRTTLVIRSARTLRRVRRQTLTLSGGRYALLLKCEDGAGTSAVVFARGDLLAKDAIYRVRNGRVIPMWKGHAFDAEIAESAAYLSAGPSGRNLLRVDFDTGRVRRLATLPGLTSLSLNAAGALLAGVHSDLDRPSQVVRVDLTKKPAKVATARLARRGVYGEVFWLPAGRLLFAPSYGGDTARVLDVSLRMRSRFKWSGISAALVGSSLFGIDQTLSLFRAQLPSGPMRAARRLPGRPTVLVSVAG